jgi:hypothetical protein
MTMGRVARRSVGRDDGTDPVARPRDLAEPPDAVLSGAVGLDVPPPLHPALVKLMAATARDG